MKLVFFPPKKATPQTELHKNSLFYCCFCLRSKCWEITIKSTYLSVRPNGRNLLKEEHLGKPKKTRVKHYDSKSNWKASPMTSKPRTCCFCLLKQPPKNVPSGHCFVPAALSHPPRFGGVTPAWKNDGASPFSAPFCSEKVLNGDRKIKLWLGSKRFDLVVPSATTLMTKPEHETKTYKAPGTSG